jgi:Tropinone reductase 1
VVARNTKPIENKLRGSARLFRMDGDVTDAAFRELVLDKVKQTWGKLDILVNNVGTNIRKKFTDYSEAEIRQLFETNLFSLTALTQHAFDLLKHSGRRSVSTRCRSRTGSSTSTPI